jgi:thioredoxin-related protein
MKFRIVIIVFFVGMFLSLDGFSQRKIQWRTWEDVQELQKTAPKKIFVDIYTEWCGWCKKMDKATFQQDHIAKYINENYYAVKFDAEDKSDISFQDKVYKYVKNGRKGYNELAVALTRGQLSFPTIVFLDEQSQLIQPIPGFQNSETFEMIATYFGEDHFKDTPWKRYTSTYKKGSALKGIPVKN